jgi:hypothetical protein
MDEVQNCDSYIIIPSSQTYNLTVTKICPWNYSVTIAPSQTAYTPINTSSLIQWLVKTSHQLEYTRIWKEYFSFCVTNKI